MNMMSLACDERGSESLSVVLIFYNICVCDLKHMKILEFYLSTNGSTGSFLHCEIAELMFVNACSNEKPCCHTKHRNFPVLASVFCACVFPSYDPNSLMPLSWSWTFQWGVALKAQNVIILPVAINT